jgi:hypothetical protein
MMEKNQGARASKNRVVLTFVLACSLLLLGAAHSAQAQITRGPYMQMPGTDTVLVVWHTAGALTDPQVEVGTTLALGTTTIGSSTFDLMGGLRHSVSITGLTPGTKYFYEVGSAGGPLTTASNDYSFSTAPPHGTRQPIRIWAFGDSGYWPGNSGTEYLDTRQGYYDYAGGGDPQNAADATDVMLHLGDNAYPAGDDTTYQAKFFAPPELAEWMQVQPFFVVAGNHEAGATGFDSINQTGDYYGMFDLPTGNELGTNGVASGSESYYSFDYGNIHFVMLDSEDNIEKFGTVGAPMLTWLENDLAATSADWIIAGWHRPPYSKSLFHDSDVEPSLGNVRREMVPILEDHGVDLVLNGHSHTYERSPLIDGHTGLSNTLAQVHILDGGDGDPASHGPYHKATAGGQGPHEGAVYVVAGAAADLRNFPADHHPVMNKSLESLGTVVIEVDGDELVGKYIDDAGLIVDTFAISKGTDACAAAPLATCVAAPSGKLQLKDNADDKKDQVSWKWGKQALDATGMDPVAGTNLRLCIYDDGVNVLDLAAPVGASRNYTFPFDETRWEWVSKKPGQFQFKDKDLTFDGLSKVKIKAGDQAKVQFKGKGPGVNMPTLPLLGLTITAEFVNDDTGDCWSVDMTDVKKAEVDKYQVSAPK